MRIRSMTLTALVLAAAVAVPAAAGKNGRSTVETPNESGCRDIVSGSVAFQNLISAITQEPAVPAGEQLGLYQEAVVTVLPKGVAGATFTLAEASCQNVDYVLEAYDVDTGQLLAAHAQKGDGSSGTEASPFVLEVVVPDYAKQFVGLRVFTTSDDVTHDVAPDLQDEHGPVRPAEAQAAADGLPPTNGGAVTSFR